MNERVFKGRSRTRQLSSSFGGLRAELNDQSWADVDSGTCVTKCPFHSAPEISLTAEKCVSVLYSDALSETPKTVTKL
jgi:hypothetical protein